MEGRTNILPKIGGLVNGDIVEAAVRESSGISAGDFVQYTQTDFEISNVALSKYDYRYIGYTGYKYPNGDFYVFMGSGDTSDSFTISELSYTDDRLIRKNTSLSLISDNLWRYGFLVLQDGNCVVICNNPYNIYTKGFFLKRENGEWSSQEITISVLDSLSLEFGIVYTQKRLNGNKFILSFSKSSVNYWTILDFDEENLILNITSNQGDFSLYTACGVTGSVDRYELETTYGVFEESYNLYVDGDGKIVSVQGNIVSAVNSEIAGTFVSSNTFAISQHKYITLSPVNFYIYEVNQNGIVRSGFDLNLNLVHNNSTSFLQIGVNSFVAISSDYYNGSFYAQTFSIDYDTGTVYYGDDTFLGKITLYDGYHVRVSGLFLISENVYVGSIVGYHDSSSTTGKDYSIVFQIVDGTVGLVNDSNIVIKTVNNISGVAKTSGRYGDTIQIYVPQISS